MNVYEFCKFSQIFFKNILYFYTKNWFLGAGGLTSETGLQNGGIHNGTQNVSQAQSATSKNIHRKSLDKGEKQEDQHNKHNTSVSQTEKSDKRFVHTNGSAVTSNDLQFIERIG